MTDAPPWVRHPYALLTAVAVGWIAVRHGGPAADWPFMREGSDLLLGRRTQLPSATVAGVSQLSTASGALHLYAHYPQIQVGPLALGLIALVRAPRRPVRAAGHRRARGPCSASLLCGSSSATSLPAAPTDAGARGPSCSSAAPPCWRCGRRRLWPTVTSTTRWCCSSPPSPSPPWPVATAGCSDLPSPSPWRPSRPASSCCPCSCALSRPARPRGRRARRARRRGRLAAVRARRPADARRRQPRRSSPPRRRRCTCSGCTAT